MKIYQQLAAFQQKCPVIHKDTEGYNYSYADLPTIIEEINPLLEEFHLGYTQLLNGTGIKTILFSTNDENHEETIESVTEIPQGIELSKMNPFQVMGSAYTYYRRYALSAMLGIVTDKDTDAQGEAKKTETVSFKGKTVDFTKNNDIRYEDDVI